MHIVEIKWSQIVLLKHFRLGNHDLIGNVIIIIRDTHEHVCIVQCMNWVYTTAFIIYMLFNSLILIVCLMIFFIFYLYIPYYFCLF